MKCFNCNNEKATCYYSPKELYKHEIYFCSKCLKLLKMQDLRYLNNKEYAEKEVKVLLKSKG